MDKDKSDQIPTGQPGALAAPHSSAVTPQSPRRKPSMWSIFFSVIGILQIMMIELFLYAMYYIAQEERAGEDSVGRLGLVIIIMFYLPTAIVASVNLLGLPFYLTKHKPRTLGLMLGIVSLMISAAVLLAIFVTMIW